MSKISKVDLKKILPFKDPFLLVDKMLLYDPDKKIKAYKYLSGKEWYLKGHFPNNPIMPGHLIAESMVQTCALFFGRLGRRAKNKKFYLAASKVRFFNIVRPKNKIIITAYPVRIFSKAALFKAEAHVKNKLVARGEFTVAIKG